MLLMITLNKKLKKLLSFLEYVKFAKLVMAQIVGNVEDDMCFPTLAFMKLKLCNRYTTHLPLVVRMFAQHFYTLFNFSMCRMH